MAKIEGVVIYGENKGKMLGFPTANIKFSGDLESGVYAGGVSINGKKYQAGIFRDKKRNLLEAHVLEFSGDLYGQFMEIEITKKIRNIQKFKNDTELKKQIAKDINKINECLPE
jgi:FAD synthase